MKLIVLVLLLVATVTFGQTAPKIDRKLMQDQIIHGTIDEKYPITVYLHFNEYSEDNFMYYSIEGWYYYDNIKKRIPLVGLFCSDLVLYQFENKESKDSVLGLMGIGDNYMERLDNLLQRSNYIERFKLSYSEYRYQGTWDKDKKTLPVTFETSNIQLDELKEYLLLSFGADKNFVYDLAKIGPSYYDYSVFAWKFYEGKYRILLKYETASSANVNGMCGAGKEVGFVYFEVNNAGQIIDYKEELIESCHRNVYYETSETPTKGNIEYQVFFGDDTQRTILVNKQAATLQLKK